MGGHYGGRIHWNGPPVVREPRPNVRLNVGVVPAESWHVGFSGWAELRGRAPYAAERYYADYYAARSFGFLCNRFGCYDYGAFLGRRGYNDGANRTILAEIGAGGTLVNWHYPYHGKTGALVRALDGSYHWTANDGSVRQQFVLQPLNGVPTLFPVVLDENATVRLGPGNLEYSHNKFFFRPDNRTGPYELVVRDPRFSLPHGVRGRVELRGQQWVFVQDGRDAGEAQGDPIPVDLIAPQPQRKVAT
jgi:hypothetical protein